MLKTDDISSFLTLSENERMKIIRETVDFDKSVESYTYRMILYNIENLIPYHSLRNFKQNFPKPAKKNPSTKPSESAKSAQYPGPSTIVDQSCTYSEGNIEMSI